MWRAHRGSQKSFPRAGAAVQCASSPDIRRVTGRTFKSALAQVRSSLDYPDKPHWFTARRTRGRSATNTIEVKTQSVRGTAGSREADGAQSAVKRLIHGRVPSLANGKKNGALEAISRRPSPRKDFDANAEALIQLGLGRIISLVIDLASGEMIEAAMIGRDSMVGAASAMNGQISLNKAIVQLAGTGSSLDAGQFRKVADQSANLPCNFDPP